MIFNFKTYMLETAQKLKAIGHTDSEKKFFRVSGIGQLDELLSNLGIAQFPALIVEENQDGVLADRAPSDNYLDTPYFVFYIAEHVPLEDHDAREAAKLNCKLLGFKIIGRMLRHKRRGMFGLTFLNLRNVNYQTIGPIGDNCYGVMFSFTVSDTADIMYNADDWEEE
jgi:hypothetical protein